jgi:site-specific DNA-adenine methylase
MKNHFFMTYFGNKRQEVEEIYKHLNLEGITTIIEPFCGTSAISFYISTKHPKKFKYILNDIDKQLIELYKICLDEEKFNIFINELNEDYSKIQTREQYLQYINKDNLKSYFIKYKIFQLRAGIFPIKRMNVDFKYLLNCPIIQFLRTENVELKNDEATHIINDNNNKNTLIILDPPYMDTSNSQYNLNCNSQNIYEFLLKNPIKKMKSNIILVLQKNWIIEWLFKDNHFIYYDKQYVTGKKRLVQHCIISN